MKNKITWIAVIVVLTGFGLALWFQRPIAVEQVLPSHPLVFARLTHVEKHINQVIDSDFGKDIAAIDLTDVLVRNNFSQEDISGFQQWQKYVVRFWKNPLIKRFLGKEVSFSLYRRASTYSFYLTLRLTVSTRIAELIGQLSHRWGDDVVIKQQEYQGRVINHVLFKKQDFGISYVRIRDLLILTPETLGNLQEIIDIYNHQGEALKSDAAFNFVSRNAYPKSDGIGFINFNLFSNFWRGEMDSRLTNLGYQTSAFPIYGISYKPGVVSKYKMMVNLDQKYMSSDMRKTFSCPGLSNDTLKLVPTDAIAYNWGACYDLEHSWDAAKKILNQHPQVAGGVLRFKRRLEHHFDMSIRRDVLPVLGHEMGGYVTDVDMKIFDNSQYPFPIPRLLIFIKVQDRAKAEALLAKLNDQSVATIQTERYNNVTIHYISSSLGANIDPGYCFLGDYLLVATSRQLLKRSIDSYNDSLRSIVSDDVINQFSLDQGEKFHSVTLMKTAELSRRAQDFLGWLDKYLSDRVTMAAAYRQDGNNKKQELDQAIADKSAELLLAQKKLNQLKSTSLATTDFQDPESVDGAINNLNREEESIRQDIAGYLEEKEDLSRRLDNYALGAQSAKLAMYNMENLFSPVLKGLESIDAQAVTVRFGDKILETEFLVK